MQYMQKMERSWHHMDIHGIIDQVVTLGASWCHVGSPTSCHTLLQDHHGCDAADGEFHELLGDLSPP